MDIPILSVPITSYRSGDPAKHHATKCVIDYLYGDGNGGLAKVRLKFSGTNSVAEIEGDALEHVYIVKNYSMTPVTPDNTKPGDEIILDNSSARGLRSTHAPVGSPARVVNFDSKTQMGAYPLINIVWVKRDEHLAPKNGKMIPHEQKDGNYYMDMFVLKEDKEERQYTGTRYKVLQATMFPDFHGNGVEARVGDIITILGPSSEENIYSGEISRLGYQSPAIEIEMPSWEANGISGGTIELIEQYIGMEFKVLLEFDMDELGTDQTVHISVNDIVTIRGHIVEGVKENNAYAAELSKEGSADRPAFIVNLPAWRDNCINTGAIEYIGTRSIVEEKPIQVKEYPHECPHCKAPAYVGFGPNNIECSKNCGV
jgi:hypothetical protein